MSMEVSVYECYYTMKNKYRPYIKEVIYCLAIDIVVSILIVFFLQNTLEKL